MPSQTTAAEKILKRFKSLRQQMQADELPLFTIPAIWDGGQGPHSTPCDIIVTNQRILGYYYVGFPRERLFFDALPLASIRAVSLREKSFEPVFRELLVSSDQRNVYIRAPRQKIESLNEALRSTIEQYISGTQPTTGEAETMPEMNSRPQAPVYGKLDMRSTFERSPLAIVLLFVGGLLLEIGGALIWAITQSAQTGLPLCFAGLVAVGAAFLLVRQRK